MPVPEWAQSGLPLIAFLFFVVFFRAQGTYWVGRAVPAAVIAGSGRVKWLNGLASWAQGPVPRKGAALLERWGIVIIPLCFLTVGLQTAVLAGSGLVRMNWGKFTIAMLPGCVAWAFLYGFGLLAVWTAVVLAVAGNVWSWVVLAVLAVGLIVMVLGRRRRNKVHSSTETTISRVVGE